MGGRFRNILIIISLMQYGTKSLSDKETVYFLIVSFSNTQNTGISQNQWYLKVIEMSWYLTITVQYAF